VYKRGVENHELPNGTDLPVWTLGERLRKARRRAGLEQADMAKHFGVSQVAISRWESDQAQPRDLLTVVRGWAELTNAPLGWLLDTDAENVRYDAPTQGGVLTAA
jgi:transcriptional regulator with XRE-family HTH domain